MKGPTLGRLVELAREGYEVALRPSPIEGVDGLTLELQAGDLHGRQLITTSDLKQFRGDAVAQALDRILDDFGDALSRELLS